MKRGKYSGHEKIPAGAIKADIDTSTVILHDLIGKIWEQEEIPTEWKEGYLVKLPKKGDMQECLKYRGIMLLSVAGKVLNRVISTRRISVEQCMEWDSSLYINCADYEKAFYSLDRFTDKKYL